MNLKFKSTGADLKFNIQSQFRILNQNVLYITRQVDLIVKWMKEEQNNNSLQLQVDKYFDEEDSSTKNLPLEDMAQDGNSTGN